jgi:hypothetical protein
MEFEDRLVEIYDRLIAAWDECKNQIDDARKTNAPGKKSRKYMTSDGKSAT